MWIVKEISLNWLREYGTFTSARSGHLLQSQYESQNDDKHR